MRAHGARVQLSTFTDNDVAVLALASLFVSECFFNNNAFAVAANEGSIDFSHFSANMVALGTRITLEMCCCSCFFFQSFHLSKIFFFAPAFFLVMNHAPFLHQGIRMADVGFSCNSLCFSYVTFTPEMRQEPFVDAHMMPSVLFSDFCQNNQICVASGRIHVAAEHVASGDLF